jgi:D-alanyl-D-alanine dipeptidase
MGGHFDFFGEISHPISTNVTIAQNQRRQYLRRVMEAHGFKPFRTEWWHFTLRDEPFPETSFDFDVA